MQTQVWIQEWMEGRYRGIQHMGTGFGGICWEGDGSRLCPEDLANLQIQGRQKQLATSHHGQRLVSL